MPPRSAPGADEAAGRSPPQRDAIWLRQSAPLLQLRVREQVRERYPGRPWLDVRTKADLPLADEVLPEAVPHGTLDVSVIDGTNVALLKRRMAQLVGDRGGS